MAGEIIPTKGEAPRKLAFTPIQPWTPPKMTNTEARRIVDELQDWVDQFNHPDAYKLKDALKDIERLFVCVWTEIDEARGLLMDANSQEAKGRHDAARESRLVAMSYLHRWQDRNGRVGNVEPI